jgi:hypothetical protein
MTHLWEQKHRISVVASLHFSVQWTDRSVRSSCMARKMIGFSTRRFFTLEDIVIWYNDERCSVTTTYGRWFTGMSDYVRFLYEGKASCISVKYRLRNICCKFAFEQSGFYRWSQLFVNLIYSLTGSVLTLGGSCRVLHIYTRTIHNTTQWYRIHRILHT